MKLIARVKLQPTAEQSAALGKTLRRVNTACDYISRVAWKSKTFGRYPLHPLVYREVRTRFGLSAQLTVRAIAKVSDAYKLDHTRRRVFKTRGAIAYDDRILSWKLAAAIVSINTVEGRLQLPFVGGEKQRELLKTRQGESDLLWSRGQWYLSATCEVAEPLPLTHREVLGVDLGVVNLAVDSDGRIYSGQTVNAVRSRHRRLRSQLQAAGTSSAKRHLRRLSGQEKRFAQDTNHSISKKIVALAQDTARVIAIEDLGGIRERTTVGQAQRAQHSSWGFNQLRRFLEYKSKRAGVVLVTVDPRNTSRTCPACGTVDKRNRRTQSAFQCVICGHSGLADHIAARNIATRASVNMPIVSRVA
jgi:IS605 OrfB family transposase